MTVDTLRSALQAEGPGFESPSLHHIGTRYSETETASFLLVGEVLGEVGIILPPVGEANTLDFRLPLVFSPVVREHRYAL